jgi:serine/threonine-protein kinase
MSTMIDDPSGALAGVAADSPVPSGAVTDTRLLSNRYRITGHIARGGMADVFAAEDSLLGRKVAVKILHPQFAKDDAFVTRFRREAQAAANLSHPNIVSIFDWGKDGETYYMVMELIEGRTLRDIRRSEGPLLARRAAEIAAEAAAALTVAHHAGVFHRDIKPGNILLTPDGSVKVMDFGIARALDDSEELTRTGAVIGTATYFSPEQAQGIPADGRSDVYSLGVVLYELLCGQPPFTGESPVAVAYQHVSEYAVPVRQVNPDVPAALETIVTRAMQKDPAARYQSAEEMRADLLGFLRGETPASAKAASPSAATQVMAPLPPATVPPDETARMVATTPDPRRTQATYVLTIISLLVALAAGIFILFRLLAGPAGDGEDVVTPVEIPNLEGELNVDAVLALSKLGLDPTQRFENSDTVEEDIVIRTDPEAGTEVDPGSSVALIVSAGPERFTLPDVTGFALEDARQRLELNGFEVGEVTEEPDQNVPQGSVIRQNPGPGEATPGTAVDLVVSSGPLFVAMPDVEGSSLETAMRLLAEEGIDADRVTTEEEFSDELLAGFVISSNPPAGSPVLRDATVTLIVSKGPEPIPVPNLVGMTVEGARNTVEDLGLVLSVQPEAIPVSAASGLAGLVAEQSPPNGTELLPGDPVTVAVGVLRQIEVPEVIGLIEERAINMLEGDGFVVEVAGTIELPDGDPNIGRVADQDPDAGTSAADGSTVRIWLGVAAPDDQPGG